MNECRERWDEVIAAHGSTALHLELLKAFLRDFPEHWPGWRFLGSALINMSRFEEAEGALQRALELARPKLPLFVLCEMGKLFRYRGDFAAAAQWYHKAIEHSPDDAQGYIYLGGMLAALGRLDEAEQADRRATACKAGCIDEAYYNLGLVLRARERYAEAAERFDRALSIDHQYKAARLARRDVRHAMQVRDQTRAKAASPIPADGR